MMCGICPRANRMAAPVPTPAFQCGKVGGPSNDLHTPVCPTGTHAPAPTSKYPSDRSLRRRNTSAYPTGSRAPAPTAASRNAREQRHSNTSPRSTGSLAPTHTSAPLGDHHMICRYHMPPSSTSLHPTGTRAQGLTLVHFSAQPEPFRHNKYPSYHAKSADVAVNSGRV